MAAAVAFLVAAVVPAGLWAELPDAWELLIENAGIATMHAAVTRFGTVVLLERNYNSPSCLPFPHCSRRRRHRRCQPLLLLIPGPQPRCYAHSAVFGQAATNRLRPLTILTDTWCSSGHFLPDGTLLQIGGDRAGGWRNHKFSPCPSSGLLAGVSVGRPARSPAGVRYGEKFEVEVAVELPVVGMVEVNFASAPFATHSFSQGQRLANLAVSPARRRGRFGTGGGGGRAGVRHQPGRA